MDNFFQKWPNLFRRETTTTTTDSTTTTTSQPDVNGVSYEARIVRPRSAQAALTISGVYRAVELRAKTEAQFQAQYQKLDTVGGNYTPYLRGLGKRLNYLLQVQPNPTMSAMSLWKQIVYQKLMLGNAVVYIERDEFGFPRYFWLSQYAAYNTATGLYTLTYTSDTGGIITKMNVPREDVLHFLNTFTTQDGLWGYSTIRYAIDALTLIKTENNQALESAAKGGRVKLLIGEDRSSNQGLLSGGLYSKDQVKKYAQEINSEIYSQDVVSLRGLDKAQSISMTAQEMQMVEMLGMGMDDVARFYATPRPLLMLDTNSHYTTYLNARMEYLSNTVQADIEEHEQELQRKLISERDFTTFRWHLCEQPIMRLDKEAQAKVDEINLRTGAKTVNEIRQQYDLPAVEGGDVVYVSTNLAELGSDKLRSASSSGSVSTSAGNEDKKGGES